MRGATVELIREGHYAAEVPIELIEDETEWSPYLSPTDALKVDRVRHALKRGDVAAASREAKVFLLTEVA